MSKIFNQIYKLFTFQTWIQLQVEIDGTLRASGQIG